jgi:hypothetical protein
MRRFSVPVLGSLAVLAACEQRPEPILPEPIYDKFGRLEAVCVDDGQGDGVGAASSAPSLPRCSDRCEPGEQSVSTVAGQWPICLPPYDGDDDDDDDDDDDEGLPPGVAD